MTGGGEKTKKPGKTAARKSTNREMPPTRKHRSSAPHRAVSKDLVDITGGETKIFLWARGWISLVVLFTRMTFRPCSDCPMRTNVGEGDGMGYHRRARRLDILGKKKSQN